MADTMTGGCQCGRVCYEVQVASDEAYWCHYSVSTASVVKRWAAAGLGVPE